MFSQFLISPSRCFFCFTTLLIVICCIVIITMPTSVQSLPLTPQDSNFPTKKRYCSKALSEAILKICEGRFNSLGNKFPESVGNQRVGLLRSLLPNEDVFYRPSFGNTHECCRRPCGYTELQAYCAD